MMNKKQNEGSDTYTHSISLRLERDITNLSTLTSGGRKAGAG